MKKLLTLAAFALAAVSCSHHVNPVKQDLSQDWVLATDTLNINLKVSIPSVVQADLFANGLIHNPYLGSCEESLQWIPQREWKYSKTFDVDDAVFSENVIELVLEGLDTYAEVVLNGKDILHADNMFRTWTVNVKDALKRNGNILEIFFRPFDEERDRLLRKQRLNYPEKYVVMRKAAYQNGWDWAPRYLDIGVWKPVGLNAWTNSTISYASIVTNAVNEGKADMTLKIGVKSENSQNLDIYLYNEKNDIIDLKQTVSLKPGDNEFSFPFEIKNPELWWPNEMGQQSLYSFIVRMKDHDKIVEERKIVTGIRTVELVNEPDSIGECFYFKINGTPTYMKGANYVPEEMLTSWMSREKTRHLLGQCVDAHFNMLRVWGGGLYPHDSFFEICDSLGILVWEDFMFANSVYPYDDEFLDNVRVEAEQQVQRIVSHPSLALWCGGNEIIEGYYNWGWQESCGWSEKDDREIKAGYDTLFENILKEIVEKYDGTRAYWPSSPSIGWGRLESLVKGDVHYWGVWWGELPYEAYREKVGRFNSEFGYQAYPDFSTLKKIDERLNDSTIQAHQKHARGKILIKSHIDKYFPPAKDFEDEVYKSQLSQAFGIGMAIEAQRFAKSRSMGSLYWQLNDAWPVVSWSSIDYYGHKKALQYKLKELYAQLLLGLQPVDENNYKVMVCSDLQRGINGRLRIFVEDMNGNTVYSCSSTVDIKPNECYIHPEMMTLHLKAREKSKCYVRMVLVEDNYVLSERVMYLTEPKALKLQKASILKTVTKTENAIVLELQSPTLVKDVLIQSNDTDGEFSDNFFDLLPNCKKVVSFKPSGNVSLDEVTFTFKALNELAENMR